MTTEQKIVSLTHNLTAASVSLEEGIPSGWMETVAIVRSPDLNIQKRKRKKGAERQKRLEDKRRENGLKKDWVPEELLVIARQLGWTEVLRRAKEKPKKFWHSWLDSALRNIGLRPPRLPN